MSPRFTILALLPLQLRIGDRLDDAKGEWEIIGGPWSMAAANTVYVFVQHPGDRGTKREEGWSGHEKVTGAEEGVIPRHRHPNDVILGFLIGLVFVVVALGLLRR